MRTDPEWEHKLLIGLVNGDESSFCELYALYKNKLIYFAMKFLQSAEFAEDVFQDAFTSVWENRRFINPNQPFAPYIYTIVKNRVLNILAGMERDTDLKNKLSSSNAITNPGNADERLLEADYNELLQNALNTLTEQQRRVFNLSRSEYKSHKEIAEELHISVYTVQQHISASLKAIREYFEKHAGRLANLLLLLACLNS